MADCAIIVFAKAPVPGQVKTRLAGVLGEEGAARLATRMLEDTLRRASEAGIGPVELCCSPDFQHPLFLACQKNGILLTSQGNGDIGVRMHRALTGALQRNSRVILIGTDAPGLTAHVLRTAAAALSSYPTVFVPASDGGYVLVGLAQPCPEIFKNIDWSTQHVMAQTRERLRQSGITFAELTMLNDVDTPEDLIHVPKDWLT